MASRREPFLTVSDLELMPDNGNRYELIDGELYLSKSPGLTHQLICMNIAFSVQTYLKLHPIGKIVAAQGVVFTDLDGVIPDLVFLSNERLASVVKQDRLRGAPELVIEILSPGSDNSRRDRIAKRDLYGDLESRSIGSSILS